MWERDSLKLSFVCKDTKCILPHIMWSVFNVKVHSISRGQATRYDGMWWPTAGAPNSHPIQPNYRTKLPALATLSLSSRICVLINSTPHWLLEFLINPASWSSFISQIPSNSQFEQSHFQSHNHILINSKNKYCLFFFRLLLSCMYIVHVYCIVYMYMYCTCILYCIYIQLICIWCCSSLRSATSVYFTQLSQSAVTAKFSKEN